MSYNVDNGTFNPDIRNVSQKKPYANGARRDKKGQNNSNKLRDFVMLKRTRIAAGVILAFFGVFLLVSCVSFLMSGAADQSEVANNTIATQDPAKIQNFGAIIGAYLSSMFMERGVGLGAFIIVLWCFVVSVRMLRGTKVFFIQHTLLSLLSI
ncbi:MAG: DNA translocase FtsK 4TM domain-containing protein, partial [Muribaculaceae bacterium]